MGDLRVVAWVCSLTCASSAPLAIVRLAGGVEVRGVNGNDILLNGLTLSGVSPMTLSRHPMDHAVSRACKRTTGRPVSGFDASASPLILRPLFLARRAAASGSVPRCQGGASLASLPHERPLRTRHIAFQSSRPYRSRS